MSAGAPLVSIITPSLNQAAFIEETIRSVRDQDHPSLEHIVVDGGSTDGTLAILERYPHVRWVSEADRGQSDALAKGFRMAQGSIFGWLNADDFYLPGAVRTAVDRLISDRADLVYGGYRVIHEDGSTAFEIPAPAFDYETLLDAKNIVPQPSAFFTRTAYEAIGGVDPRYHYAMDYDLWVRLGSRFPVTVVDEILSCFRFQEASKSVTAADLFYPEMRAISRRNGGRFFSRMYLDKMPVHHPILFRGVIAARALREQGLSGILALARRRF